MTKLAPLSQPMRSKTKTNRLLPARIFPRLEPVALLQILIGSLSCLLLLWLVRVIALILVLRHPIENHSNKFYSVYTAMITCYVTTCTPLWSSSSSSSPSSLSSSLLLPAKTMKMSMGNLRVVHKNILSSVPTVHWEKDWQKATWPEDVHFDNKTNFLPRQCSMTLPHKELQESILRWPTIRRCLQQTIATLT